LLRTVVESELVASRIDAAIREHPQIELLYEMLKWRITREPFKTGRVIEDQNPTSYITKTPFWGPGLVPASIAVVYQVTDDEILFISSRIDLKKKDKK